MTDTNSETAARSIDIPEQLGERIDRRIEQTRFDSADEYATFVLGQVLGLLDRRDAESADADNGPEAETADAANPTTDEGIEEQLESLGYL